MPLKRQDLFLIIALMIFFICITTPGIAWGTPDFWHPDELAKNVDKQLNGIYKVDEAYFNHPFLPSNVMLIVGKIIYKLGYSRTVFILTVRFINVFLSAGIVALGYLLTRLVGGGVFAALIAAGLVISSSEIALNARIAHDDIPLAFFTTLAVLLLVQYRKTRKDLWLFLTFFAIGLATASKYNGVSLILAPVILVIWDHRNEIKRLNLRALKLIIWGCGLALIGFGLGSPQIFRHFRLFVTVIGLTMRHHAEFNTNPNSVLGIVGQWPVLFGLLGILVSIFCILAVVYELSGLFSKGDFYVDFRRSRHLTSVIMLSILALNLPMLFVKNYPARFFVTLIPLFTVLVGLFFEDIYLAGKKTYGKKAGYAVVVLSVLVIAFSMLRVLSIALLYFNDARVAARDYIAALPARSSIEYTIYSPSITDGYFLKKRNYPLFFPKSRTSGLPGEKAPKDVNSGEAGLEERRPDYLIVDSFIYERFSDPYTCQQVPVECTFFQRLLAGETQYQLERVFEYHLPDFLPQLTPFFLNPTIRIYHRVS